MAKLYLIGIGGTGSRVMNSLLMLLAAGVKINYDEIVPLIIDTDFNNGNLRDFKDSLKIYRAINQALYSESSGDSLSGYFFREKIAKAKELSIDSRLYPNLKEMINYDGLNAMDLSGTRKMIDLLFSNNNLEMELNKGFLGNPNIGSVVLNKIIENQSFREFTQEFTEGDRIFIISSIFGGTGAAGFPLLLNNFRDSQTQMDHGGLINEAIIGGVSVLPYFEVEKDEESAIDSNTFLAKTKAALSYYNDFISNNVNALYYIGDKRRSMFSNSEGGEDQKNNAHFVEFAAALSIIDFTNWCPQANNINQLLDNTTEYFEFGISQDDDQLNFKHITGLNDPILMPLIKFHIFNIYMNNHLELAMSNPNSAWRSKLGIEKSFNNSDFLSENLKVFIKKYYAMWLSQLNDDRHGRKFYPFNMKADASNKIDEINRNILSVVNERPIKFNDTIFKKDKVDFETIVNDTADKILENQEFNSREKKFMSLLNNSISRIYENRFRQ